MPTFPGTERPASSLPSRAPSTLPWKPCHWPSARAALVAEAVDRIALAAHTGRGVVYLAADTHSAASEVLSDHLD